MVTIGDVVDELETTANILRCMTLDPAIPSHAKEAMWSRIATLECISDKYDKEPPKPKMYVKCECLIQNELRGISKPTWSECPNCVGLGFYEG